MKRTDEMKLGEDLRGFCDCNQGRLCCTCRQFAEKTFDRAAKALNEGGSSEDLYADLVKNHQWVGRIERKIGMPPEMAAPYGNRPNPIERFSVAAQLQLMKALAILGWAAFFLELLRV